MQRVWRWLSFNRWYFQNPPWDTGISPPELLAFLQRHPPGQALDLGCGSGANLVTLARHGWRAIGVDFALPAVWRAWRKLRREHLPGQARLGDVTRLDWLSGPFDLILDIGCYHGLRNAERSAYRAAVQRLLGPAGAWLVFAHLKPEPSEARGIAPGEVDELSSQFRLTAREDGVDRERASAWFTFEKR